MVFAPISPRMPSDKKTFLSKILGEKVGRCVPLLLKLFMLNEDEFLSKLILPESVENVMIRKSFLWVFWISKVMKGGCGSYFDSTVAKCIFHFLI